MPLDVQAAVLYGHFINAAYAMYAADEESLTPSPAGLPMGWDLVAWLQMSDFVMARTSPKFYGFIARDSRNASSFVLAIRGTEGVVEWADDADIAAVPFEQAPNAGHVARGFDQIYGTMKIVLRIAPQETALAASVSSPVPLPGTFADQVAQAIRANAPQRQPGMEPMDLAMPVLAVTGHSLGAALATLYVMENAAKKAINNPTLCTFASPRVGSAAFVDAFNALGLTSWRLVNAPDWVPNLPPDVFGFQHVDALSLFNSTGKVRSTLGCAHSMDTYLSLLDSTLMPSDACTAAIADQVMADRLTGELASNIPTRATETARSVPPPIALAPSAPSSITVNVYFNSP